MALKSVSTPSAAATPKTPVSSPVAQLLAEAGKALKKYDTAGAAGFLKSAALLATNEGEKRLIAQVAQLAEKSTAASQSADRVTAEFNARMDGYDMTTLGGNSAAVELGQQKYAASNEYLATARLYREQAATLLDTTVMIDSGS